MKRFLCIAFVCAFSLSLAGCGIGDDITPREFTAKADFKADGSYDLSYDGTVSYLPMMEQMAEGTLEPEAEKATADKIAAKLSDTKDISNVSYEGDGVFKLTYRKSGNLNQEPMGGLGQKPLLEMTETPEGKLIIKFLSFAPDVELPAKARTMTGSIEVTTELAVESVTANPEHKPDASQYLWKVSGIVPEMPGIVMRWQRKEAAPPPVAEPAPPIAQ